MHKIELFSILVLIMIVAGITACNNSGGGSGNGDTDLQSGPFSTIAELQSFLDNCEGGEIESDPILLKINIDLGNTISGSVWYEVLDVIKNADKYVALDLSACSVTDNKFETHESSYAGKEKIVSIIFPDDAESLPSGYSGPSPFRFALKEITGKNIITIGNNLFVDCPKLDKVSFPKATSIGQSAFNGCSSLKNVSFPEVTSIGSNVFSGCDSLEIINFPKAESIGEIAFSFCNSLESVCFPEVTSIGQGAFWRCNSLKSISFPKVTSIGSNTFFSPIISIIIAADCTLTTTAIRDGFDSYYNNGGKAAGTYIFNGTTWEGP